MQLLAKKPNIQTFGFFLQINPFQCVLYLTQQGLKEGCSTIANAIST